MKKLLFCMIFVFSFVFFSRSADAMSYDDISIHEIIGVSFDEFIEHLDNVGPYIFSLPQPYYLQNPDWLIESPIRLDGGSIKIHSNRSSAPTSDDRTIEIGQSFLWHDMINLTMTLEAANSGLLFDSPGRLTLMVISQAYDVTYTIYRSNGSADTFALSSGSNSLHTIPIAIDNQNNDLLKIVFNYNVPAVETHPGYSLNVISCGIEKYGYIIHTSVDPEPDIPQAPDFSGNVINSLNFILSTSFAFIDSLFLLNIASNISLGYFLFAVMILALVFSFFFHKLVK